VLALLALSASASQQGASQQGAVIRVAAGDNLQAALDRAKAGDTILLAQGARFSGSFVLPAHAGTTFITIRTGGEGLPGPGVRTSPRHAAALAELQSSDNRPALRTAPRAHHWRIENVAFGPNRNGDGNIIELGDSATTVRDEIPHTLVLDRVYVHGDPAIGQKRGIALNSATTEIVNSHISDIKSTGFDTQAICGWNGPGPFLIDNNYLEAAGENIMFGGADPAVRGLLPQDITITRNHITRPASWREPLLAPPATVRGTASGEGTLAAGTYIYKVVAERPAGRGEVALSAPADSEDVRLSGPGSVTVEWAPVDGAVAYRVYRTGGSGKPMSFRADKPPFTDTGAGGTAGAPRARGTVWQVKNLLELKMGRNVRIDGNLFERHWLGAQSGYAFVFKPSNQNGRAPWTTIENIQFTNNVVREVGGGINIHGKDATRESVRGRGIVVRNNLFVIDRKAWGGPGDFVQIGSGPADVAIERNTVIHDGRILSLYGSAKASPIDGLVFRGNVLRHNQYGVKGDGTGIGRDAFATFAPDAVFEGNVIAGGDRAKYPEGNRFIAPREFETLFVDPAGSDFRLRGEAPARSGVGAEWDALTSAFNANTSAPAAPAPRPRSTN
jgi:hypothetical protein